MRFNDHSDIKEKELHAFLSPSQNHWLNYTVDKLKDRFSLSLEAQRGTELHAFASYAIRNRIKLNPHQKRTLNMFVNDCIGFQMESEQVLYYSPYCFGTADAISFKDKVLKIFDLKTGITKVSFRQLDVYAALFCLEYNIDPYDIQIEQRLYQNDECITSIPEADTIKFVMERIIEFDMELNKMSLGVLS